MSIKMKRNQPRNKRRQEERRHIAYLLKNNFITKSDIPTSILLDFIHYIRVNRIASFGIKNIHRYDLNLKFTLSSILSDYQGLETLIDIPITILGLACYLNRDLIVSSLVGAGSNPIYLSNQEEIFHDSYLSHQITKYFQSEDLPVPVMVWIVKLYQAMVLESQLSSSIESKESDLCNCCMVCMSSILCCKGYPCKHLFCERCFWNHIFLPDQKYHDISCPYCDEVLCYNPNWYPISLINPMLPQDFDFQPSTCFDRKSESLKKWIQLPIEFDNSCVEKRPKFTALPYSHYVTNFTGSNQSSRNAELFKCVIQNNILRLQSLSCAGVNIDIQNEYGQTPLHIACWKGYSRIVIVLLSLNASISIVDNGGYHPFDIAISDNHTSIIDLLNDRKLIQSQFTVGSNCIPKKSMNLLSTYQVNHISLNYHSQESIPSSSSSFLEGWQETFTMDDIFSDSYLDYLLDLSCNRLPIAPREKLCSSDRAYFCDMSGSITSLFQSAIYLALQGIESSDRKSLYDIHVFPQMRFLFYREQKGSLPPHVDLSKTLDYSIKEFSSSNIKSTHTLIFYLTTCEEGGSTVLLKSVKEEMMDDNILSEIHPRKGRLLVFPHLCPHAGQAVESVPKILIRGEVYIKKKTAM